MSATTMMTTRRNRFRRRRGAGGFTLIETMLVIVVVGVLVAITLLVGRSVFSEGKVRQTQQILTILDSLITEYQAEYQSIPPYVEDAYRFDDLEGYMRSSSGSDVKLGEIRPEVAVFIEQGKGLAGFDSMLATIPPEFMLPRYIPRDDRTSEFEGRDSLYLNAIDDGLVLYSGQPSDLSTRDPRLTIRDSWGMEILYVHPDHREATTGEDADISEWHGFGRPKSRRPYFVSAGPDLIYYGVDEVVGGSGEGAAVVGMDDNIYSYRPEERLEEDH